MCGRRKENKRERELHYVGKEWERKDRTLFLFCFIREKNERRPKSFLLFGKRE